MFERFGISASEILLPTRTNWIVRVVELPPEKISGVEKATYEITDGDNSLEVISVA